MDNLLSRHRKLTVLVVVLCAQFVGLAVQVKRNTETGSVRLIRLWSVTALTPFEKAVVHTRDWTRDTWRNYFYLRNVRKENEALRAEIERMRLERVRLAEDANQARRLQALLGFKEQFIEQTLPAQVISTTGSDFSRGIYIDKGSHAGVRQDMPVITPDGVVGKIYKIYPTSSLVLVINDPSSGAGVILENSRLQGILKGTPNGETFVSNIMATEQVQVGENVRTSGGDRIYPKGLMVGKVAGVAPGGDSFLNVRVQPAAQLSKLEEVLVITKVVEKEPEGTDLAVHERAADILAERLPKVPPKPPELAPGTNLAPAQGKPSSPSAATAANAKPGEVKPTVATTGPLAKPASTLPAKPPEAKALQPKPQEGSSGQEPPPTSATPKNPQTTQATKPVPNGTDTSKPASSTDNTVKKPTNTKNATDANAKPANIPKPGPAGGTTAPKPPSVKPDAGKPSAPKPDATKAQTPPAKEPPRQ